MERAPGSAAQASCPTGAEKETSREAAQMDAAALALALDAGKTIASGFYTICHQVVSQVW